MRRPRDLRKPERRDVVKTRMDGIERRKRRQPYVIFVAQMRCGKEACVRAHTERKRPKRLTQLPHPAVSKWYSEFKQIYIVLTIYL